MMFRRAVSKPRAAAARRCFASYDAPHANYVPATTTTLSNGVRVVTQPTDSVGTNLSIYIDAGGRGNQIQGHANFCHKLSMYDRNLHKQIENIGGAIDATIDADSQVYSTILPSSGDAGRAIELIGKAVTNPAITSDGIVNVKEQVLYDLDNDPRSTREILEERLRLSCWRDGDLGYALYGTHDATRQATEGTIAEQYKINQTGNRLVISATGQVDHQAIVNACEKQFGKLAGNKPFVVPERPYFLGSELVYRDDEMGPTAFMAVGYRGVPSTHAHSPAFTLLRQLIGEYDPNVYLVPHKVSGNRMREAVSHKMMVGCAEKVEIFHNQYKDTGMIGWYVEFDEIAAMSIIDEMMFAFNYHSFSTTEEEIDRAKRELVITKANLMDNCGELAKYNARCLSHQDRIVSWAEWYHRIMQIGSAEINHVCYERIHDEEVVLTGLGPLHGYESLFFVRRMNGMWRYGY